MFRDGEGGLRALGSRRTRLVVMSDGAVLTWLKRIQCIRYVMGCVEERSSRLAKPGVTRDKNTYRSSRSSVGGRVWFVIKRRSCAGQRAKEIRVRRGAGTFDSDIDSDIGRTDNLKSLSGSQREPLPSSVMQHSDQVI